MTETPLEIDVAEELKDRFLGMYFFIPEGSPIAALFERLHDDVDAIPRNVLKAASTLIAKIEPIAFERYLQNALGAIGNTSFPNSAAEFLQSLNYVLALDVMPSDSLE